MLVSFSGFLRFNELVSIKRSDLVFKDDCVKVNIRKSKTDQLRKGDLTFICKTVICVR